MRSNISIISPFYPPTPVPFCGYYREITIGSEPFQILYHQIKFTVSNHDGVVTYFQTTVFSRSRFQEKGEGIKRRLPPPFVQRRKCSFATIRQRQPRNNFYMPFAIHTRWLGFTGTWIQQPGTRIHEPGTGWPSRCYSG